jgi:hypothetical protein
MHPGPRTLPLSTHTPPSAHIVHKGKGAADQVAGEIAGAAGLGLAGHEAARLPGRELQQGSNKHSTQMVGELHLDQLVALGKALPGRQPPLTTAGLMKAHTGGAPGEQVCTKQSTIAATDGTG